MKELKGKQKKQHFRVVGENIDVQIEVKPWSVKTKTGIEGGILTVAYVFTAYGYGVKGETVCIPTDEFDFRFGAELALSRALNVHDSSTENVVGVALRKAVWDKFNQVLPPN